MRNRTTSPSRVVFLPMDQWPGRAHRARAVVLHGRSVGGPDRLSGDLLGVLVDVERRGLHIVLVAGRASDLDSPVAAICRQVLSADAATLRSARSRWGTAQVLETSETGDTAVVAAVASLPPPASRTLRRRLRERVRRLGDSVGRFRRPSEVTR